MQGMILFHSEQSIIFALGYKTRDDVCFRSVYNMVIVKVRTGITYNGFLMIFVVASVCWVLSCWTIYVNICEKEQREYFLF